jgi:hypothetical protein
VPIASIGKEELFNRAEVPRLLLLFVSEQSETVDVGLYLLEFDCLCSQRFVD